MKFAKNQAKSTSLGLTFTIKKLLAFFNHIITQKQWEIFWNMCKELVRLFSCDYMIDDNENEVENEK